MAIYTVSELNKHVREVITYEPTLQQVWLQGEVSNLTKHSSGHYYFTLKDENSQISCVSFRSVNRNLRFEVEKDMKLLVFGNVDLYTVRGQYQFQVLDLRPDGVGELYKAYEQLKKRLDEEGLFDPAKKQFLPDFPRKVGVATSPTGAAVHDIINVLKRRYPVEMLLAPTVVQGEQSADSIVKSLEMLDRAEVDVIILGRGGGSLEDLWSFNEEKVARAIYSSKIPIISAVGHETDYTIADFVADVRAPTPSAAAEIAAPDREETKRWVEKLEKTLGSEIIHILQRHRQSLESLKRHIEPSKLERLYMQQWQHVDEISGRLPGIMRYRIEAKGAMLSSAAGRLNAVSPLNTLARGYGIVLDENGVVINTVAKLSKGSSIEVLLRDGKADCIVENVKPESPKTKGEDNGK
ncbi:exodeoxyribonuclease VII large subunit [Methanohalophilus levihalophilus]|uniref:exodeoxyribonuclease VII large subunit n=1 Tax=Methanohalophilus levihalophilus TaxID=1431282 RepID=UPI001AE3AB2F|nr:exodeoxyribonuclease VII large subunit [Methanohalophilus levihalophilus]MBP2030737.1 exodeoxyribonuclease VII large subunit [Methanohalophilus levihalophilus]